MTKPKAPARLQSRGRKLWDDMLDLATFNAAELVILEEACRTADRLERLDRVLSNSTDGWLSLREQKGREDAVEIAIDGALSEARQQANILKQLVAALRIPDDASGRRPQQRGGARGAYKDSGKTGTVSSLDRARQAAGA